MGLAFHSHSQSILIAVFDLGVAHRRLSLPPWLAAIALENFPAPTLSEPSLHALAGDNIPTLQPVQPITGLAPAKRKTREENVRFLYGVILKYGKTATRYGETIQRAKLALQAIETDYEHTWTPSTQLLREWLVDELKQSLIPRSQSYELSTLYTYTGAVTRALGSVPSAGPIEDWEMETWDKFIAAGKGDPNFNNSFNALLRSLRRRGYDLPRSLLSTHCPELEVAPRDSSSASLITNQAVLHLKSLIENKYRQTPLALSRQRLRLEICTSLCVRGSEPGSLMQNSILESGVVSIRRQGYSVHKNANAIRLQTLSPTALTRVRELVADISAMTDNGPFLLRGHGTPAEGETEEQEQEEFNELIKLATDNSRARTHSMRASTLQNLVCPEWQSVASALMSGELCSWRAAKWLEDLHGAEQGWTSTSMQIGAAGHADLRASLGYYMSNWPMLVAIASRGWLAEVQPSHQFIRGIGLKPNSLRVARIRHQKKVPEESFCYWQWICQDRSVAAIGNAAAGATTCASAAEADIARPALSDSVPASIPLSAQALRFLMLRSLQLDLNEAVTKASLPLDTAIAFNNLALPIADAASALKRDRGDTGARAVAATIDLVRGEPFDGYLEAAIALQEADVTHIYKLLIRNENLSAADRSRGASTLARLLPIGLILNVCAGPKHLDALSPLLVEKKIQVRSNHKLGGTPSISLTHHPPNLVADARLLGAIRLMFFQLNYFHQHVQVH